MAIVKKEAYFNSSTGVNKIRTLIWSDTEVEPIAILQIAHGVCEHIGRYEDFAIFLASQGYIVCGNDHIGHGKSVEYEADLGFTAEKDGYRRFVDDMHILYNIMHKRYPNLPYFMFGHSMGSLCARVYAATFGSELSGLIICGTAQVPVDVNFTIDYISKVVDKFGPRTVNHFVASMLNKVSSIQIKDKESDLDWLSVNKENVENYKNDPLCGQELSLAGVRDLAAIGILASDKTWASSLPSELPVMIISGALDPVGMNGKGPIDCADSLSAVGIEPLVIIYPCCRHEILNEDSKERVYNDVIGFMSDVLNS